MACRVRRRKCLLGKSEGNGPFRRSSHGWGDNIEMDLYK